MSFTKVNFTFSFLLILADFKLSPRHQASEYILYEGSQNHVWEYVGERDELQAWGFLFGAKKRGEEGGNLKDKRWRGGKQRILPGNRRRQQERQSMRQRRERGRRALLHSRGFERISRRQYTAAYKDEDTIVPICKEKGGK